jgi:hypothetical protein
MGPALEEACMKRDSRRIVKKLGCSTVVTKKNGIRKITTTARFGNEKFKKSFANCAASVWTKRSRHKYHYGVLECIFTAS